MLVENEVEMLLLWSRQEFEIGLTPLFRAPIASSISHCSCESHFRATHSIDTPELQQSLRRVSPNKPHYSNANLQGILSDLCR